jgi:hypothetical protein
MYRKAVCVFLGAGAAIAAPLLAPAYAQEPQVQRLETSTRNEVYNYGIPRNYRQAPSLGLGNIYGLNPCATGVSVGATTPLFGIGGAFSTIDDECQIRNNVALTVSALKDEALAREIMCSVEIFRAAAIRVGRPCIRDGGAPIALSQGANPETATSLLLTPIQGGLPPNALPPVPQPTPAAAVNGHAPAPEAAGFRGREAASVPAFCDVPGLNRGLYQECDPNSRAAPSPVSERPRRARPEQQSMRPAGKDRDRPITRTAQMAEVSAPPALLGRHDNDPEGCSVASATVRALFAECAAAGQQPTIVGGTSPVVVSPRPSKPTEPSSASEFAASCGQVSGALQMIMPGCAGYAPQSRQARAVSGEARRDMAQMTSSPAPR